jgi:hypothetical protein
MRRAAFGVFVMSLCLHAQKLRLVSGVVVDDEGKPVGNARIDYSNRLWPMTDMEGRFSITAKDGRKWIIHGIGRNWSAGIPRECDVWHSVQYQETTYDDLDTLIGDARGETADGKRWRTLERFGESASYKDVDEITARLFDQVLDCVCLRYQ